MINVKQGKLFKYQLGLDDLEKLGPIFDRENDRCSQLMDLSIRSI